MALFNFRNPGGLIRKYPVNAEHCMCGKVKQKNYCRSENERFHVCTREKGHKGDHHSHSFNGVIFSKWSG